MKVRDTGRSKYVALLQLRDEEDAWAEEELLSKFPDEIPHSVESRKTTVSHVPTEYDRKDY